MQVLDKKLIEMLLLDENPQTIKSITDFIENVERCRYCQKQYFKHRDRNDMISAKKYESLIDKFFEKLLPQLLLKF